MFASGLNAEKYAAAASISAAEAANEVEIIACDRLEKAGLLEHPDIGLWLTEIVTRVRHEK